LNVSSFIVKRILTRSSTGHTKQFSKPIVNLAITGVALGVGVMLLSSSIAVGFQSEIKKKVVGFGAHYMITEQFDNNSFESVRMTSNPFWLEDVKNDPTFNHVQKVAFKPAILQSREVTDTTASGADIREISGVLFKGVGHDFDQQFIRSFLKEGKFPSMETTPYSICDSIVISGYTAKQLKLSVHDKVACFFISSNGPQQRNLSISGIYETGLEDFDKQFAYVDINLLREINHWGIEAYLEIKEECVAGLPVIEAKAFGGNGSYIYQWNGEDYTGASVIPFCPIKDTVVRVIISDSGPHAYGEEVTPLTVPDTAWLKINVEGSTNCSCAAGTNENKMMVSFLTDSTTEYRYGNTTITTESKTSGGSHHYYCGGFEVNIKNISDIKSGKKTLQLYTEATLNIESISERYEEIFKWLDMLDMNVYIILGLMIFVAVINMLAVLLVMIIEQSQLIGMLKAMGGTNWLIRKIFIGQGAFIIIKGLLIGNALAICIIWIQHQYGIITLPESNYYITKVPMYLPWLNFLLINVLTFVACTLSLLIPSAYVARITPVKAIKFE
jgi:lipoprotein-releasing system permease protein